jgi:hypothetical protein
MVTALIHLVLPLTRVVASIALLAVLTAAQPRQNDAVVTHPGNPVTGVSAKVASFTVARGDYYPIVHLRKLHLVRPDLIPYPIYYPVYC